MWFLLFLILVALSILSATKAASSPNPNREKTSGSQKYSTHLTRFLMFFVYSHRYALPLFGLLYISISIAKRNIGNPIATYVEAVCPNVQRLENAPFQPTFLTALPIALMLIGGTIRAVAFSQLGKDFTFRLQKPTKLTTTGLYAYVQHPSYSGAVICVSGIGMLLFRIDGLLSCWSAQTGTTALTGRQIWTLPLLYVILWLSLFVRRIRREEKMLRNELGEEWQRWHDSTDRLIPGIW